MHSCVPQTAMATRVSPIFIALNGIRSDASACLVDAFHQSGRGTDRLC